MRVATIQLTFQVKIVKVNNGVACKQALTLKWRAVKCRGLVNSLVRAK